MPGLGLRRTLAASFGRNDGDHFQHEKSRPVARLVTDTYSHSVSDSDQLRDIATAAAIAYLANPAA